MSLTVVTEHSGCQHLRRSVSVMVQLPVRRPCLHLRAAAPMPLRRCRRFFVGGHRVMRHLDGAPEREHFFQVDDRGFPLFGFFKKIRPA